jgi:hypothetical protein
MAIDDKDDDEPPKPRLTNSPPVPGVVRLTRGPHFPAVRCMRKNWTPKRKTAQSRRRTFRHRTPSRFRVTVNDRLFFIRDYYSTTLLTDFSAIRDPGTGTYSGRLQGCSL